MPGIIFDIQNYAIYDGPGIRSCVYFKGCPLQCRWCHNPESQKAAPEMGHMREKCALCGKCVECCPNRAIDMLDDHVSRNREKCAACGACAEICPNGAIEKIGVEMSADQIVAKIVRDKPFYENSGGGVTISGGEPTFQKEFLIELLRMIKDRGINTAIETSGYFSGDLIPPLLSAVDLFLFDLKHMDTAGHREAIGAGNEIILDNFAEILSSVGPTRLIPRIPLIPGFNTDDGAISDMISFLKKTGYRGGVHLLPHHGWAKSKYEKIGRGDSFRDPGNISEKEIETIKKRFAGAEFKPLLHG